MTFANTPQGLEKDPTKSSDVCPQQKSVEHFTICNGWLVLLISVFCAAMSVPYLFFTIEIFSSDPWEDLAITLVSVVALLIVFGLTGVPGIIYFILALVIWTIPHKLIVDGQGSLILRSLARDRCIAFKDINLITVEQQQNGGGIRSTLKIKIRHSGGILALPHFAECETFLNALKVAYPSIVMETI